MKLLPNKIFNLILLDLLLPGMSGVELLARVRHSGSRIPCVVVTGSHDQKDRRLLEDLGVQAIFDKPANYEIVTDLIGELIST
jgi:CheY-like chemotaxis protein